MTSEGRKSSKMPFGEFSLAKEGIVVCRGEATRFMRACMEKVGAAPQHAQALAEVLAAADHRSHYSHGLNRLDMYVNDIKTGVCERDGTPKVVNERSATAWGMSMTNTSPLCYPTRGKKVALGTNPFTVAAPAQGDDEFVLDMATTTVAIGKVEIAQRKGVSMPSTWGADSHGHMTDRPEDVIKGGGLLPLGGVEASGGYKGYGLGATVELMCGILAGAHWGPHVRRWMNTSEPADLGQMFMAIDPDAFAPGFRGRMQEMMDTLRNIPPANPELPVLVAGDPERQHIKLCEQLGGIPYHPKQIEHAAEFAAELGVKPLEVMQRK